MGTVGVGGNLDVHALEWTVANDTSNVHILHALNNTVASNNTIDGGGQSIIDLEVLWINHITTLTFGLKTRSILSRNLADDSFEVAVNNTFFKFNILSLVLAYKIML